MSCTYFICFTIVLFPDSPAPVKAKIKRIKRRQCSKDTYTFQYSIGTFFRMTYFRYTKKSYVKAKFTLLAIGSIDSVI